MCSLLEPLTVFMFFLSYYLIQLFISKSLMLLIYIG